MRLHFIKFQLGQGSDQMLTTKKNHVRRKIFAIYLTIALTSLAGLFVVMQLERGFAAYENTIQYQSLSGDFNAYVAELETIKPVHMNALVTMLEQIQSKAQTCVQQDRWVIRSFFKMLGIEQVFEFCQNSIELTNKSSSSISQFEIGEISEDQLKTILSKNGLATHDLAFEIRPLISTAANAVLVAMVLILFLIGIVMAVVTRLSSKSIYMQFQSIETIEGQLRQKNTELEELLANFEQQRQQTDKIAKQQKSDLHKSMHDPLTKLPNRRFLNTTLSKWHDDQTKIAIFQIDIDHFKSINDTHGHIFGDFVLKQVSKRLKAIVEDSHLVARVGGDELFVVVPHLPKTGAQDYLEKLADKMVKHVGQPVAQEDITCDVSISVGVASVTDDDDYTNNYRGLYHKADLALYQAKSNGRNGYVYYDKVMEANIHSEKELQSDILRAIKAREFIPYFQPQIFRKSLQLAGVVVSMRWRHPEKGVLEPDEFLKTAERLGVTADIERIVFEKAYSAFKGWNDAGFNLPRMSVKVSYDRLVQPKLVEQLKAFKLKPGQLALEISENILMHEDEVIVQDALEQLREIGVDLELSNFGLRQASILQLTNLNPKRVKIERELLTGPYFDDDQIEILSSIAAISKMHDLEIVATGIETEIQMELVKPLGCDILQGFYFLEPTCNLEFELYLQSEFREDQLIG